jgi:hypothetical protein
VATHHLKSWPGPFGFLVDGRKRFEWRRDDRDPRFVLNDWLHLREWIPDPALTNSGYYTGRLVAARVSYIIRGPELDVPIGYVVMSLDKVTAYPRDPWMADQETLRQPMLDAAKAQREKDEAGKKPKEWRI